MIAFDFTVPDAVNANADLYSKVGVPFVMGTTGGDLEMLYKRVEDSKGYALISPQMGKQFSRHEPGVTHVLVTGGAGFIGSHAAPRLPKDSYRITIVVCHM
ncbi:hypothetical protein MKW94_007478 [Papaver nudicaule]|uniref:Uncharacterized protein n=1 Tax=Papaver nudicaule TaxID=74823 RepID=A0AA41VDY2_PAPNU|nr:hypothetical protein [Papaver nudicaule]